MPVRPLKEGQRPALKERKEDGLDLKDKFGGRLARLPAT